MHENTKMEREAYDKMREEENKKTEEHERMKKFGTQSQIIDSERELERLREKTDVARKEIENKRVAIETSDEQFKPLREEAVKSSEAWKTAKSAINQKISDDEYSEDVKKAKKDWEEKRDAGKTRMHKYAERLEKKFGAGNKAAAKSVRDTAEGKEKKDKKKLFKDLQKEFGIEEDETKEETPKPKNKNSQK